VLRYQSFQPEQAALPEEVGADLSLFKLRQKDAIDAPREQP
jgi:hypothetical protein